MVTWLTLTPDPKMGIFQRSPSRRHSSHRPLAPHRQLDIAQQIFSAKLNDLESWTPLVILVEKSRLFVVFFFSQIEIRLKFEYFFKNRRNH